MGALAVVAAAGAGAVAGWLTAPVADAVAGPRYGPASEGHDPEDFELALLRSPTTPRTRAVAAAVLAAAAALLAAEFDHLDIWLYFAALTWAYVVAAIIDLQYLRLPDVITWPAAAVALLGGAAICARFDGVGWDAVVPGALATVVMAAVLWAFSWVFTALRGKEAFGLGDLKLQLSLGVSVGWLGWTSDVPVAGPVQVVILAAMAGFLIGSLAGLPAAGFKVRRPVPFGPFLMAGWFVVVLLADSIRDV